MTENTERTPQINNQLLAALPTEEYKRIYPKLEKVILTYGETIYQRNADIQYVYFPNSGIISFLNTVDKNSTVEIGLIGKEGFIGLALFLGVKTSGHQAIVQGTGLAMRMKSKDFIAECQNCQVLSQILQRFTYSLLTQLSQATACYRFHPIEPRLARWLLMTLDRMATEKLQITQELLSNILGVRREAVNKSAVSLQQQKLISYSRGNITIIDRKGLEQVTCQCYRIIKDEEKNLQLHNQINLLPVDFLKPV